MNDPGVPANGATVLPDSAELSTVELPGSMPADGGAAMSEAAPPPVSPAAAEAATEAALATAPAEVAAPASPPAAPAAPLASPAAAHPLAWLDEEAPAGDAGAAEPSLVRQIAQQVIEELRAQGGLPPGQAPVGASSGVAPAAVRLTDPQAPEPADDEMPTRGHVRSIVNEAVERIERLRRAEVAQAALRELETSVAQALPQSRVRAALPEARRRRYDDLMCALIRDGRVHAQKLGRELSGPEARAIVAEVDGLFSDAMRVSRRTQAPAPAAAAAPPPAPVIGRSPQGRAGAATAARPGTAAGAASRPPHATRDELDATFAADFARLQLELNGR